MSRFFNNTYLNTFLCSLILVSFIFTYAVPVNASVYNSAIDLNEVAFILRMKNLVDKLVKSKDKGNVKVIENLIKIKHEIEYSRGIKIDLGKSLENVEQKVRKAGQKMPKDDFLKIKTMLYKEDKRKKKQMKYIAATMYLEDYEFNKQDLKLMFPEAKKHKDDKKDDKKDEEEVKMPALLVWGVSLTLCGVFLFVLPIPPVKKLGQKMIETGVATCAGVICEYIDNGKKDENKKLIALGVSRSRRQRTLFQLDTQCSIA